MIWIIVLSAFFVCYPLWLFLKLARYGQNVLRPNFERMQRKITEWTGFDNASFFAYNRAGGKLVYYFLFFYLIFITGLIIYKILF
jgi:cytochrome b subunit of formate dehydrogenase